jgi:hypothetical protein
MNMPGFSAGFSVYRTNESYRMGGMLLRAEALIRPAQFLGRDCFGSLLQCIANHCIFLRGPERAACDFACAAPSRCGPCTCNPTCTWTCRRSSPGALLTCTEPCTPVA